MKRKDFAEIQEDARAHIREMKKVAPYIYPEYSRLHTARIIFAKAKIELEEAEKAWQELGS
jgi:hypothetical protein